MGVIIFTASNRSALYIVDFCSRSRKLIIEVDGSQHLDQKIQDDIRTSYLESLGFRVMRFWNDEVLRDTDTVLQVILQAIQGEE